MVGAIPSRNPKWPPRDVITSIVLGLALNSLSGRAIETNTKQLIHWFIAHCLWGRMDHLLLWCRCTDDISCGSCLSSCQLCSTPPHWNSRTGAQSDGGQTQTPWQTGEKQDTIIVYYTLHALEFSLAHTALLVWIGAYC